jgi:hypothetical protein
VKSKIYGALLEDGFIPFLQGMGCDLNEISFEQDTASPHTLQILF